MLQKGGGKDLKGEVLIPGVGKRHEMAQKNTKERSLRE